MYQKNSLDPPTSVCAAPPRHSSLGFRESYFSPFCIFTSERLSLLICFVNLLPTVHLLLWKYENMSLPSPKFGELSWGVPHTHGRESAPKAQLTQSCRLCLILPLKLSFPNFGNHWPIFVGERRYQIQLQFYRFYVWPIYMGRAPTKPCSQLRDVNLREAVFLLLT